MEFDYELISNYVSLFVFTFLMLVTCVTIFQKLKLRWPAKVRCWFCHGTIKVWRQQLNWWFCPSCKQYNGFSKDGDYMYDIPEQYKSATNTIAQYCAKPKKQHKSTIPNNSLCEKCNGYEELKLAKLSVFEPTNQRNFDSEIKQFKQHLEQKYPLCNNCTTTVQNVLHKQMLWLNQYKMLLFKQKPIAAILNNGKTSEMIFRIALGILDSITVYNTEFLLLPIGGLFFQLCACWVNPRKEKTSDILSIFLWICIIILLPLKELKLLKTDIQNEWFSVEYVTQYHIIVLFAFIIGIMNVKQKSRNATLLGDVSFKKMIIKPVETQLVTLENKNLHKKADYEYTTISDDKNTTYQTLPNATFQINPIHTTKSSIIESVTPNDANIFQEFTMSSKSLNNCHYSKFLYKSEISNDNALMDNLNALSLSDNSPEYTDRSPKMFETREYSTTTPDIFRKLNNVSSRKFFLTPPKLKLMTQASCITNGYWQENIDRPTLSRSSSQSSGFGSIGSNFGPSREPSVYEFDRCSVTSDAAQSCYSSNAPSMHSLVSSVQRTSLTTIRIPSTCNKTHKSTNLNTSVQQMLQPQQNSCKNDTLCNDTNNINKPINTPTCSSYTTVILSPVWLFILLCCSLVLNIIVLCTTCLH